MKFAEFKNYVYAEASALNAPVAGVLVRELLYRRKLVGYGQYLGINPDVDLVFEKLEQNWDENMTVLPWPPARN